MDKKYSNLKQEQKEWEKKNGFFEVNYGDSGLYTQNDLERNDKKLLMPTSMTFLINSNEGEWE